MAMQDIVMCVGTEDVFFESMDHFSDGKDSYINGVLGYECWMNEPRSIKERRETFLHEMGFIEPSSWLESNVDDYGGGGDDDDDKLERMVESRGDFSSSCYSSDIDSEEENVVFCRRECNEFCNADVNEQRIRHNVNVGEVDEPLTSNDGLKSINKKIRHWWQGMMKKQSRSFSECKCKNDEKPLKFEMSRVKVHVNKKKFKELSAVFATQEIQAHKGMIWTMKFSPDGQYLATGGEDGVVRVWCVKSVDSSSFGRFPDVFASPRKDGSIQREEKMKIPVVVPNKVFKIEEVAVQEFHGHDADVLDLAWSSSNLLLSSSMDKTVRLWQLGSSSCLSTLHHTDYVTCLQFNPVDNRYFISGSIDGKIRIWGVSNQRVIDWAVIKDAVTAVCYQPDGKAFVVGSLSGSCQFYETRGDLFEHSAYILLHSSRRSSTNRITGIQFSPVDSQRVLVMSEDSTLRILDKMEVVNKFQGLPKSGSQMSASFTPNGRHIMSIGQDSRVYLWTNERSDEPSSRHTRSNRSCEYFYSEGVSVALPWCNTGNSIKISGSSATIKHEVASISQDPPNLSSNNIFSFKGSATWPQEMLPALAQTEDQSLVSHSSTSGLAIVTANCDGLIKTFQNYGLPSRV